MNQFIQGIHWIFIASHWDTVNFQTGIRAQLAYHVELSALSLLFAACLAIPVGLLVGHKRRGQFLAVSVANVGRAVPSFALVVLAFIVISNLWPRLGFSMLPTMVALTLLAIPPMLTNTYVGIQSVDRDTVEAARGMGMTERQVLLRLEIPVAASLIMAGLRTSAVTVVATATLAGFVGGGGLGAFLYGGFAQRGQEPQLIGGALLVAALAILTEVSLGGLERLVTPKALARRASRSRLGPVGPEVATAP